ncbi:MAG: CapA family protein [Synergistaceae bacterium]|nr:CapA family protein [Synergistaceae bacterium]
MAGGNSRRFSGYPATNAADALSGVRLLFVGDIMTHLQQLNAAKREDGSYDFSPQFEKIRDFLVGDLVIGNLETSLGGGERYSGYPPAFNTPDELADELKEIGFNVLLLANNHIYDQGAAGLKRTTEELDSRGFFHTGAWGAPSGSEDNAPLLIELKGIKIGIFNYASGSNVGITEAMRAETHLNIVNESSIKKDIEYLRENGADFIIATFHWGVEYEQEPTIRQRNLSEFCLKEGADMVMGAHPHVLQPIEIFESGGKVRMTAYSLGNFVCYQTTVPRERSVILAVTISDAGGGAGVAIRDISIFPIYFQITGNQALQVVPASEKPEAENSVIEFLDVSGAKDPLGFYILYAKKN